MTDLFSTKPVVISLLDLIGEDYVRAASQARACLTGESSDVLIGLASRPIDFFPIASYRQQLALLPQVGQLVCPGLRQNRAGATSHAFKAASLTGKAPLSAAGLFRVGEDGRLYLITKSEHYHTPLGHAFPGYQLLDVARRLGIPNATHNNTRGHITRLLEEELLAEANGVELGQPGALDCVLNLETGSLATEAAFKMMLARFYQPQNDSPAPRYGGRTPVLLVMGDDEGTPAGNYHGTTVLLQAARGLWHGLTAKLEEHGILRVVAIRPNNIEDLERAFAAYEQAPFKIAGFLHEIVMMNYGGRLLGREFLSRAYTLCRQHDVPTLVDEIQSCMWAPQLYLFREYGLEPTFVAVGKGFPGGEYPASRLLFNSAYDSLPQFGALVTNGQEELASLAYLVTMRWAKANAAVTAAAGQYYEQCLRELAGRHRELITGVEGWRHMGAIDFAALAPAKAFAAHLNAAGLDISAQTYKPECPPVVLTKIPLIAGYEAINFIIRKMDEALDEVAQGLVRPQVVKV